MASSIKFPKTSFQDAKLRRMYEAKDFDNNGYVSSNDFAIWGKIAAEKVGLDLDDEGKEYWVSVGESYFGNTKSYDEWTGFFAAFIEKCPNYREISRDINVKLFKAVDSNKDGVVNLAEYKAFVTAVFPNLTDDDVEYGFNIIDEDGDGVLSQEEVATACAHYYYDEEDTKYKHFYGRWDEKSKGGSIWTWLTSSCYE
ncbi:EF-hand domain-containing protein [Skeletonema marinoi]|uniref:EF-hand domain-containing protein n=1 Tax=Skeletonema marinoi TaxID=267567 RepID=A0AAD8YLB8_9STRA|nr:EF-hand domain-containing protein [Skeletonema marinoi]